MQNGKSSPASSWRQKFYFTGTDKSVVFTATERGLEKVCNWFSDCCGTYNHGTIKHAQKHAQLFKKRLTLHISTLEVVYYLVIERCPSEHHWDFIGPLWFIFPFVHLMVPKMQAAWISNQPVRELTPNLKRKRRETLLSWPAQQANTNVQMQHICCWRGELQWCKDHSDSSKPHFLE